MAAWWNILDVERDADLRAIKRAYAGKLKTIRQDEDPAGFMELRAAYEHARMALTQSEAQHGEQFEQENWHTSDITELQDTDISEVPHDIADTEPNQQVHIPGIVELLMDEVRKLMKSPWGAGNIASWENILDDDRLDDLDEFADFENAMFNFLLHIHGYFENEDIDNVDKQLPANVGALIFNRFGWHNKRNSVNTNPHPFDFLAGKLLEYSPTLENTISRKELRPEEAPSSNWFDGKWLYILLILLALGLIASFIEDMTETERSAQLDEARRLITNAKVDRECTNGQLMPINEVLRILRGNDNGEAPDSADIVPVKRELLDRKELLDRLLENGKIGEVGAFRPGYKVCMPKQKNTLDCDDGPTFVLGEGRPEFSLGTQETDTGTRPGARMPNGAELTLEQKLQALELGQIPTGQENDNENPNGLSRKCPPNIP